MLAPRELCHTFMLLMFATFQRMAHVFVIDVMRVRHYYADTLHIRAPRYDIALSPPLPR